MSNVGGEVYSQHMTGYLLLRSVDSTLHSVMEEVDGEIRLTPYVVREPASAGLFSLGHETDTVLDMDLSLLGNGETPEDAVNRLPAWVAAHG